MITLIITKCQNDFITGTISVNNGKTVIEEIKKFISKNKKEIEQIIFAIEWHPYNHCSFKKYGGEYQKHCIQFTPGACIEPKLLKLIQSFDIPYDVSLTGVIEEIEELSAFSTIDYVQDSFGERYYLDVVEVKPNTEFIICGIDENHYLCNTIKNMVNENIYPKIFVNGIASDDKESIKRLIKEFNLLKYEK